MRIYKEIELEEFEAWSGAVDTMDTLKDLECYYDGDVFRTIENCLTDGYLDYDETELNDFLWFETETIAEWLGFESWELLTYFVEHEGAEPIDLTYEIGDGVLYDDSYGAEIIDVDVFDKETPYRIRYIDDDEEEIEIWVSEDEIESME